MDDRVDRPLDQRVPSKWTAHLDELIAARVVVVVGAPESGKTTFSAWLANELRARGLGVGIVDADVGQSEIGPPATVGLGAVQRPLGRTGDAEVVAFEFVGVTSPGRRPRQVTEATGRLVKRARSLFDRVIVDTSGFVTGGFAAAVKQRKIAAVDADVVVAIQVADECEHIVRRFSSRGRPSVLRLSAVRGAPPRSAATRRRHREAAFARYFAGARAVTLPLRRVTLRSIVGAPVGIEAVEVGTLVGLRGADGGTLGLGLVEATDTARGALTVRTIVDASETVLVTIGEVTAAG